MTRLVVSSKDNNAAHVSQLSCQDFPVCFVVGVVIFSGTFVLLIFHTCLALQQQQLAPFFIINFSAPNLVTFDKLELIIHEWTAVATAPAALR